MKRFLVTLFSVMLALSVLAQVPQAFKYQTVVRDNSGEILANQDVYFRISILQESSTGTVVYSETFSLKTNDFGLAAFNIGQGAVESGDFLAISWSSYEFWVKVELDIDASGSAPYEEVGTSQLLSVPYALTAKSAANAYWIKNVNDISYNAGKVGVGTSNPTSPLYVKGTYPWGTATVEESTDSHADIHESALVISNQSNIAGSQANIMFSAGNPGHGRAIISGTHDVSAGTYNGNLTFKTRNGATSYTNALTLRSSGNVGINETDPDSKLHVNGNAHITGILTIDGSVAISSNPVNINDAVNKAYVDLQVDILEGRKLTDIEGNIYNTVTIGKQVWMRENLKVTKYRDGTPIPNVTANGDWNVLSTGAYCWYSNQQTPYGDTYGALYNWHALGTGELCPTGWHVPTDEEWTTLTNYLETNGFGYEGSGNDIAKSIASTSGWTTSGTPGVVGNDQPSNNASGFTSLPAGYRIDGTFQAVNDGNSFWSSTEYESNTDYAWYRHVAYHSSLVVRDPNNLKSAGMSIRCIKDAVEETTPESMNINSAVSNLNGNGVITDGTVDANTTGFGAALFIASDGNYEEADADGSATMPCVALALETGTGNKKVLLQGFIRNDAWNWTPGGLIYVSPTTGSLTQTIPSTSGQQVQIVGYASKTNTIYFSPNLMLIEIK